MTLFGIWTAPATAAVVKAVEDEARTLALEEEIELALDLVRDELVRANKKFPPYNSFHEAFGVIQEEVDEFFDEVKANQPDKAIKEVIQVAATAARTIVDLS